MCRIFLTIPVFNESRFLEAVLLETLPYFDPADVLVVDDGSADDSSQIAAKHGVQILRHPVNLGKGAAIKSAVGFAVEKGYDWLMIMDGDGQHPARSLPDFIRKIDTDRYDLVLGNRVQRRESNMPLHRFLSNGITSILVSLCAGGQRIHDSQCGFRAIRLDRLRGMHCRSMGFQVESEMLIKLGRAGAKFEHVPIATVYGDQVSSIRIVRDTLKFIKLILKSLWW